MTQFVVHGSVNSAYLRLAFPDGRSPLEYLSERLSALRERLGERAVKIAPEIVVALPPGMDSVDNIIAEKEILIGKDIQNASDLFRSLDRTLSESIEQVIWVELDAPFFRVDLACYLYTLQLSNWCDYTFADGFPAGYAVQVLRRDILTPLAALAESRGIKRSRSCLFDALSVDIDAFDIETEAAHEDWAMLRAGFTVDTRANALLCRRIVERGLATLDVQDIPNPDFERFPDDSDPMLRVLLDEPTIRRTIPRYCNFQVTERMTQRPYWTPWAQERWAPPQKARSMSVENWRSILGGLSEFSPEAIVSIGYRGEPSEHPEITKLLLSFAEFEHLTLYVETDGTRWSDAAATALVELPNLGAVIVMIDAIDEEDYCRLRGDSHEYAAALQFTETLARKRPGLIYVQATRSTDNEEALSLFYKRWDEADGVTPLIEKYNSYAGRLPDRRPADLTPLTRPACVHLERDIVVRVDGTVVMCQQDLDAEHIRGNLLDGEIEHLWSQGAGDFADHCSQRYSDICRTCDEYYTFNI